LVFTPDDEFNAVLYGSAGMVNYAQPAFAGVMDLVKGTTADLFNKGIQLYNKFNSSAFIDHTRNVINRVLGVTVNTNTIQTYESADHIRLATLTMQRWIMACPEVRKKYHAQQIDGYAETYVDVQPDAIGDRHYDYRVATDGLVQDCGSFVNYSIDYKPDDRELTLSEKVSISRTWARAAWLLKSGVDITDPTS
jgi:hypothetical protein